MRCSRAQEMLSRYAAGECSPLEEAAVAGHLAGCSGCAARLAELQGLNQLLDLWRPEPAPEDLLAAVMQEVGKLYPGDRDRRCRQAVRARPGPMSRLLRHLAVAATLSLALSWGIGPWLASSQALAVSGADRLVHSYATASDSLMKGTVGTLEGLSGKLNIEEWMKR